MGRCEICGQVNGHADGCPNSGKNVNQVRNNNGGEIRCNFCGTINPAGTKKCRSCNASLEGSIVRGHAESNNRIYSEPVQYHGSNSTNRPPTIKEEQSVVGNEGTNCCPQCGYPLRPGSNVCPQCHASAEQDNRKNFIGHNQSEPPIEQKSYSGSVNRNKSVPIWNNGNEQSFKIGLCDKNGEISNAKTFSTDDIVLGREELAAGDNHISSKHIHITNENGLWYVEDVSSTHQTYIVVKGKTVIENGDVIVLGNKYFRFVTE